MTRLLAALLALTVAGAAPAQDAVALETAPVARADLPRVYRLDGVAEAISSGTVSAQTTGRVVAVNFDVDDVVRQGEVLIELEDTQQRSEVRRARANLEAARVGRQDAERDYRRISEVFARDAVSKAEMDKVSAALDRARANEQAAEAALNQAEQALAYTRVEAPYNGIVTARLIEVGETAQPGVELMSGISLDSMRITVDVPQNLVETIRRDREARVLVAGRWIAAEAVTVFPIADPRSDTFKIRLRLPDGIEGVFPGMYVKAGFVIGAQDSLIIPLSAVVMRSEVVGVYVLGDDGRVSFRHVRLGSPAGHDHVSVLSGLDEGEAVAVDPIRAAILLKSQRTAQADDA